MSASSRPFTSGTRRSKSSEPISTPKFLDEKLAKVGLDLVMTRTARKVAK
jgi:hypothetical protein